MTTAVPETRHWLQWRGAWRWKGHFGQAGEARSQVPGKGGVFFGTCVDLDEEKAKEPSLKDSHNCAVYTGHVYGYNCLCLGITTSQRLTFLAAASTTAEIFIPGDPFRQRKTCCSIGLHLDTVVSDEACGSGSYHSVRAAEKVLFRGIRDSLAQR
ncbi:hypothetical protein BCR43DRAFT_516749 [Syncephalastrum racemosum]|uniref:Uncharacterized protein n=1 Tax=Syncephalastrum racemosum TaxID=13706 RepID=A0A1X2H5I3_SYNRA|nr:hypothetical protein BCR43DRAFT_516749 [Syncephalastrum racemosum]